MQIIKTLGALDGVPDTSLRPILDRYRELIELATIYVIQPGDTLEALNAARGAPFAGWEFIAAHDDWYEAVIVTCDFGDADIVLVPQIPGIDPDLLAVCQRHSAS